MHIKFRTKFSAVAAFVAVFILLAGAFSANVYATVGSATSRNGYIGNSATSTFSYSFKIFAATELLVTIRDTSDIETTLVRNTDYTVAGVGATAGGSITLIDSGQSWLTTGNLTTGYALSIRRVRPLTQSTDIRNSGAYYPRVHEDTFDQLVMNDQQLYDGVSRSCRLAETVSLASFDPVLPPAPLAGQILGINSTADGFEWLNSITGPTGPAGATGPTGPAGPAGATGAAGADGSAPLTTKGDLLGYSTAAGRIAACADGEFLEYDSAQTFGVKCVSSVSGTVDLTTDVTGVLPIASGGTNSSTALNNNRVMVSSAGSIGEASAITASRVLVSDTNGIPTHSAVTTTTLGYVDFTSSGQTQLDGKIDGVAASVDSEVVLFSGTGGKTSKRATGTGVAKLASGVLSASAVDVTTEITGAVPLANGGTGVAAGSANAAFNALSPMTTAGDIIYGGVSGAGTRLAKGTDGQVLTLASGVPSWANATGGGGVHTINAQTGTSYTFALTDGSNNGDSPVVTLDNASAVTATVPANASVAFPTGAQIDLVQQGAGPVTVVPDVGVTINAPSGADTTRTQFSNVSLLKIGTDTWNLYGDLLSPDFISATGGVITTDGDYKIHTFNADGTFSIVSGSGDVESLVVGGAGGGGSALGGGGGGGEVIHTTPGATYGSGTSIPITIGLGGAADTNGGDTTFGGITALGGGAGGTAGAVGNNGGSGGGGSYSGAGGNATGTGNNGSAGNQIASNVGGGGGGAGAVGGASSSNQGGAGGAGVTHTITGASVVYGAGGGGAAQTGSGGLGGSGVGGNGGSNSASNATNGAANTGSGGGGSTYGFSAGTGSGGVVVLRYKYK